MINSKNCSELGVLAMIMAAASTLLFFIKVSEEVVEGETDRIDQQILTWLRSDSDMHSVFAANPSWIDDIGRDITALGSPIILGLFVLIAAFYLLLAGRWHLSLLMLLATSSGLLASVFLKQLFDRPRPAPSIHGLYVYSSSFPSGHAMLSALVYLTLGALIARLAPTSALKFYVMLIAFGLTGLVGISRVYLGVHWPTDVLAGWAAGAAWALGCGAIARTIHLNNGVKQ